MDEESSNSLSPIIIPESRIRVNESNIQAQLENFEKEVSERIFLETCNACDDVRDKILNYEDEPQLSKIHNNCRRIFIASDLFINICSIHGQLVDNELTKIIYDLVQWEKYKKISRKIMHKLHLQTRREKHFAKEAESKLLKSLEDAESRTMRETESEVRESTIGRLEDSEPAPRPREDMEQMETPMQVTEQTLEAMGRDIISPTAGEKRSPHADLQPIEEAPRFDVSETLAPPLEGTLRDDIFSNISDTLAEMRAEPMTDTSHMQNLLSNISRQDLPLLDTIAETSIREPIAQDKADDELNRILQILEEGIPPVEVGDVPQPTEHPERSTEVSEQAVVQEEQTVGEKQAEDSERSEEWSLPSLEPVKKTKKRTRLIIDEVTIIPEYAARALHLNRNINIQRVQVFEGPPNILQGISVNHLMRTPGFKSSLFQDVRSSKLSALYSRHLELEKRPIEPVLERRERRDDDVSKARVAADIVEEVGERLGMRSALEKSDLIAEFQPDKSHLEHLAVIPPAPSKESLIGMPLSRIISSAIEPPEEVQMERINAAPILPTPRVQQLQGKSLDPKPSSSWFFSSKQNPPSGKYREFNYVYNKLLEYWSLFEIQGMEKCITLKEFFAFEEDSSVANYLTALRIVDKLSIQRKLLLECKNNDVFIRPFESPYASDGQLLLKENEPIF